jgi:hypothetical protein
MNATAAGDQTMKRRAFVAGSGAAALGTTLAQPGASEAEGAQTSPPANPRPQLLELRRYRLRFGPMEARWGEYAKGVLVPALNRAGVKPVGAFTVMVGPDSPAVYLLLPHSGADSVATLATRIADDTEYRRAAETFRALPATDPPYLRREASLLVAFDSVPTLAVPAGPLAAPSRVFELRIYESHNETAGLKKIEMFEKAGEIGIFRRVGLAPVFFARNLIGPALPALTYMLVFADVAGREKAWAAFREDPEWVKLRSTPGYTNPEILSNVTNVLLRPTDYSQV